MLIPDIRPWWFITGTLQAHVDLFFTSIRVVGACLSILRSWSIIMEAIKCNKISPVDVMVGVRIRRIYVSMFAVPLTLEMSSQ